MRRLVCPLYYNYNASALSMSLLFNCVQSAFQFHNKERAHVYLIAVPEIQFHRLLFFYPLMTKRTARSHAALQSCKHCIVSEQDHPAYR